MQPVTAAGLIDAWDSGLGQHPVRRALTLLRLQEPSASIDMLADLPIGERDRRLVRLRERLAGPRFDAAAECPVCHEKLDLTFTADDLCGDAASTSGAIDLSVDDYRVHARVPSTADVIDVLDAGSADVARVRLLARCITSMRRGEQAISDVSQLPPHVAEQIERALAHADPMSDLHVSLSCPNCAHEWQLAFDIVRYLWEELGARAERLLCETHTIAMSYGWTERDILAMSDARRKAYLRLLEGA